MPVFISYSHQDRSFVDKLAAQLVRNKVNVWLDRWELHVGDSLLDKVQSAIGGASALLVVLSRSSVSSAWCRREINSGLVRELEERSVIILPVLIEECEIPLFLREKIFADFRQDFDDGLREILDAVSKVTNANTGRLDSPQYLADWAFDWGFIDWKEGIRGVSFYVRVRIILLAKDQPFTVLLELRLEMDQRATSAHVESMRQVGEEVATRQLLASAIDVINSPEDLIILIEDQVEVSQYFSIGDRESGLCKIKVSAHRLGSDTNRNLLVYAGDRFRQSMDQSNQVTATPPT